VDESACKKAKDCQQSKEARDADGGDVKSQGAEGKKSLKTEIGKDLINKSGIVQLAMGPEVEDSGKTLGS
jgi:hypothetical protein